MSTLKRVLKYLNEDPICRDNDDMLCAKVWWDELEDKNLSGAQFLVNFAEGMHTSPEQIIRCRRKLQEETPGLRGKTYLIRHKVKYQTLFQ